MRISLGLLAVLAASTSAILVQPTANDDRAAIQSYLQSVYVQPDASAWASLSDDDLFTLFNNLTFFFPNAPQSPTWSQQYPAGRKPSKLYAGTECDCLHINLTLCKNQTQGNCPFWPLTTFLNMDYIATREQGFPDNVWFEGLTFPGEWAWPLSCQDPSLGHHVYAFHQHVWLYPMTGFGVWFNTGKTAIAPNKVAFLLKYGTNTHLGDNTTNVMDTLASTVCPGYQTLSQCEQCEDPSDPTKCCCHGSGYNLGSQVIDVKSKYGMTWTQALDATAHMYLSGEFGQDQPYASYPNGTFFCIRDLLDRDIFDLLDSKSFDTLQFTREPQHSGGHYTSSDPAYAFELLLHSDAYNWNNFCEKAPMGVLDPVKHIKDYTVSGFIDEPVGAAGPLSSWTPRPDFAALFQRGG